MEVVHSNIQNEYCQRRVTRLKQKTFRAPPKCAQHNQENWHVCPTFNQTHKRRKRCYPRVAMKASPTHYTCDCL